MAGVGVLLYQRFFVAIGVVERFRARCLMFCGVAVKGERVDVQYAKPME